MRENNYSKIEMKKRLAALLVAFVFMFGTAVIPSQIYAVEADDQAAAESVEPEAVTEEAAGAEETEVDVNNPEAGAEEAAETEATAAETTETTNADLSDLIVVRDEDGNNMDLSEIDESQYNGFIYKLEDDTTKADVKEMKQAIDDLNENQEVEEVVKNELYTADSVETISEVVEPEKIECIEPNYIMHAFDVPNDPEYGYFKWQLVNTKVPDVWNMGMFGDGATVAVLDTGVNMEHPDLDPNSFVYKYNAITGSYDVGDVNGHGTAVTGIIAEKRNNGIGFTGAMPGVKIMPVKVLHNNGTADTSTIIRGLNYAVTGTVNGTEIYKERKGFKPDVINMSFGGDFDGVKPVLLEEVCIDAVSKGIILVSASGNEATPFYGGPVNYPAGYDCVISVASVDSHYDRAITSNYNNKVMVAAPGHGVCVITNDEEGYDCWSGTSFAAPQVSALAAMVKSYNHDFSPSKFMDLLKITSKDLGRPGYDVEYGYGLIDFSKAYGYITNSILCRDMSLSGYTYVYDGGVKTPGVTLSLGSERLVNGRDYAVSYASGRKAIGTYRVTVTGIGKFSGTKAASFTIIPPLVKGIKSPSRAKKKLTVRWKAMSKKQKKKYKGVITGYQVRVSTNASFSGAKYASVKGLTKTKATVKGLKKKTYYYVQYRSYKTTGSGTYYSKWSGIKRAKTK